MDEMKNNNRLLLIGTPLQKPEPSHLARGKEFYSFPLEVVRLSGTSDKLNILMSAEQLPELVPSRAGLVEIDGELRSFNNRAGIGPRLVLSVLARGLYTPERQEYENTVELSGTLCRPPTHRMTPLGREISDILLAVRRRYGRYDYIPCVVWGQQARECSGWDKGHSVRLTGRFQSREYTKLTEEGAQQRTAYEVSVAEIQRTDE